MVRFFASFLTKMHNYYIRTNETFPLQVAVKLLTTDELFFCTERHLCFMLLQLQQKYLTHEAKQGGVNSHFHLDIKLLLKWTALTLK